MTYKAIVVDDETKLREVTRSKLQHLCPEIDIVGEAANVPDAYALIQQHAPHVVFLDIAMPGENGFDLLDRFTTIDFEIVFVTGFNDYAIDALRVSAVDYVLKPVLNEDIRRAVDRVTERIRERSTIERYEVLKHNIDHLGQQSTRIAIPGAQAYEFVAVEEIVRCEGWEKYTRLHLTGGQVLVASTNIGHFRELLEPYGFFACHKSHLINRHRVKRYLREGSVVMSDDAHVPVARRRRDEFMREVLGV